MFQSQTEDHSGSSDQIRVSTFLRKWYYFAITIPVCIGLGVVHYFLVTPTYVVTARILIQERGRPLTPQEGNVLDQAFLPTHAEILSSPSVISRAVPYILSAKVDSPEKSPIDKVLERLEVRPLAGTNVISITYTDEDPEWAIDGLSKIIDSYREYLSEREQSGHQETIVLLDKRTEKLRQEIADLQVEYQEVRSKSPLLGNDADAASVQRNKLMRVVEELVRTQTQRIALENQLETLLAMSGDVADPKIHWVAKPAIPHEFDNQRKIVELLSRLNAEGLLAGAHLQTDLDTLLASEVEYSELRKSYGEKHPSVLGVADRIQTIENRLNEIAASAPAAIRQETSSLRRRETQLASLYQEEFAEAKKIDEYLVKQQQKLDEIELVKSAHDTIVMQLNELRVADQAVTEGRSSVLVSVLDGPILTDELLWPQPKPLFGICVLAGLASGFCLVFASEKLKQYNPTVEPSSAPRQLPLEFSRTA
ncbi:Chain length determinant protein [Bremerella volcania]|uniref:Chain length determinant protein n=1 Tax=Bremerella volcania TaxID=2527984 RepID=A0A518C935_9BACT|nr:hypothetical protein [Bremerella volcania]QDU75743.1 Chain length determinant protein [Bremerella volcania]